MRGDASKMDSRGVASIICQLVGNIRLYLPLDFRPSWLIFWKLNHFGKIGHSTYLPDDLLLLKIIGQLAYFYCDNKFDRHELWP